MPLLIDSNGDRWFSSEAADDGFRASSAISCHDSTSYHTLPVPDRFNNYGVWFMLENKKGNWWTNTRNTGLYRCDGVAFTRFSE